MLLTLANIPNPPWFQAVSIVLSLAFAGVVVLMLATLGALAGRVGGWLAERRGHGGTANTTDSASQNTY